MYKIIKNIKFYLFIGLISVFSILWYNLVSYFPESVPFYFSNIILKLLFQSIPIILSLKLLIEVKKKIFPNVIQIEFIKKIKVFIEKPINYFKEKLEEISTKVAKSIYDFQYGQYNIFSEQMFYLFNFW
jgi:hypothetical protein